MSEKQSVLEKIVDELFNAIASIAVSSGYRTNLGISVYSGGGILDIDSLPDPTTNIIVKGEDLEDIITYGVRRNDVSVSIEIYTAYDPIPSVSDVKLAIGKNPTLNGSCDNAQYNGFSRQIDNTSSKNIFSIELLIEYTEYVEDPYKSL